jgi:hypothetical protein
MKMLRGLTILLLILLAASAQAANRYWIGAGGTNNNWNSTTYWSTTSGGAGGASVPGNNDLAIFDGNGTGSCTINAAVNVAGITVQAGYTGTISQGANTITIGTSGALFSGGTFTGGSSDITSSGAITISGTAFTSTSGILSIAGNYTLSSGSFAHNSGTVKLTATGTITGSTTLDNLEFNSPAAATFTINSGTTLTVNNTLAYAGSSNMTVNTGTIDVKGNISLNNTGTGGSGTAWVKINGTGSQTITGNSTSNTSRLGNVEINKSSGTLTLLNTISVVGAWTYTAGTISPGTSTVAFCNVSTITGSHTLANVLFYTPSASQTFTIASGTTLTVTGTLKLDGGYDLFLNTGTINAQGNIEITNQAFNGGGTATININGTGSQTMTGTTTNARGALCKVIINKASGTLTLANFITVNNNWTYTAGTIDATTNNSTVTFKNTLTIAGSHSLNHVYLYSNLNYTMTIASGTELTVLGTLYTVGGNALTLNTGIVNAKSDINLQCTANGGGGTATLKINGTGSQTVYGYSGSSQALSRFPNVEINKSSGTLTLQNYMAVAGNWTYTAGTISYGTSTVIFINSKTITGTHALYNVAFAGATPTFTIASGTTVTVNGILQTSGTTALNINTGAIYAKGDINLTNTATTGGGSATITINGDGSQVFTGSGVANTGRICHININKASGALTLSSVISCAGSWTYTGGSVDATTNASTVAMCATASLDAQGTSGSMAFHHLTIHAGTTTIAGELNAAGNITINSGTTLANSAYAFNVGGNWTNSGTYTPGTAAVKFNGDGTTQTIQKQGAAESFYAVEVYKPSGGITLNGPVNIASSLTLSKGVVTTTSANILSLSDNATTAGASDQSYIAGPIKKTGNDAFTFPLGGASGGSGYYHPLGISAPSSVTDAFTAEYFPAVQTYGSAKADVIESISTTEYWTLQQDVGSSSVTVTLGWNANSTDINNIGYLTVAYWDGAQWSDLGDATITVAWPQGTVAAPTAIGVSTSPKPFVIAQYKNTQPYVVLKRKLDGGFYTTTKSTIRYKFDDEYNNSGNAVLTYKVYDATNSNIQPTLVTTPNNNPVPVYGDNRFTLDLFSQSTTLASGYYILEVTNDKAEKWYLRIKK